MNENAIISYNASNQSFNLQGTDNILSGFNSYLDYCQPYIERYYPVYYPIYHNEPNRTEGAFKIVSKLMEKGLVKNVTLKKFIELVNEIAKEIL